MPKENKLQNYIQNDTALNAKSNLLRTNYESEKKLNEQSRKNQLQSADIARQKLVKYLPEYNAAMGLQGNGVAESTLLDADARLRSQVGQIHQKHDAANAQLLKNYSEQKSALYDQARTDQKEAQEKSYNLALDTIANWTGSSEELEQYKESMAEKLSDEQMQSFLQQYNTTYETVKQDEATRALYAKNTIYYPNAMAENITEIKNGKNFTVKVGDKSFKVQFDKPANHQYIKNAASYASVPDGGIFECDGDLYYKNGEEIYGLERRPLDSGSNESNYQIEQRGGAGAYDKTPGYEKLKKYLSASVASGT